MLIAAHFASQEYSISPDGIMGTFQDDLLHLSYHIHKVVCMRLAFAMFVANVALDLMQLCKCNQGCQPC